MADERKPLGIADEMQKLMDAAARGRCDGDGPADVTDEYKAAHAAPVAMRAAASNEVIDLAESHVGEDGATFWDWYFGGGYVNGARTPWCACFVSWCLDKLGVSCAGIPSSYVPAIQTAAADAGKALSPTDAIEGDVIIFDWNKNGVGDHIGFCVANHDGWMDTVEGNVSNSVGNRSRYHSDVLMAIRPDYDGQAPAPDDDGNVGNLDGETGELLVDGDFGPGTIANLQRTLQYYSLYQNCIVDGSFGSLTAKALQQYLQRKGYYQGCVIDGSFGGKSVLALQQYTKDLGYYWSVVDGVRQWCILDGSWGAETTKALQRALNSERF